MILTKYSSPSTMAQQGRMSATDNIHQLEMWIEELEDINQGLKLQLALHKGGRKHSKKEL
jgi:hypothetical protein